MGALVKRFGVAVATVLFAASCGSDGDDSPIAAGDEEPTAEVANDASTTTQEPEQAAVPETSTSVQPSPTTTPAAVDPEEWVNTVNEKISDQRYESALAGITYDLLQPEKGFYHVTFDAWWWRDLAAVNATFAEELPQGPEQFTDLTEPFRDANSALAEHWAVAADDLEADAEAEALGNYEVPEDWDTYLETNGQAEEAVTTACFALRDAVIDNGLGLINCVGVTVLEDLVPRTHGDCLLVQRAVESLQCGGEPEDDVDPSTVERGESELAAGATYTFNAFARPFALTIDEPTQVNVQDSLVQIAPVDSDLWSMFWILAVDEIADPAAIADNPFGLGPLIDMPADFGEWVEGLPFKIASEGQSTFGGATVRYWRLEVEPDPLVQPEWYDFAEPGPPLGRDGIFWLLAHPDGPLIVYTLPFGDEPLARSADEKFAYVEATLRTLELIASS